MKTDAIVHYYLTPFCNVISVHLVDKKRYVKIQSFFATRTYNELYIFKLLTMK